MKKRLPATLLALSMVFSLISVGAWADENQVTIGPLTFCFTIDDQVRLERCDPSATGEIVIPETVNNLPVFWIGQGAFNDCADVTAVHLPDSITYIGPYVFEGCSSLVAITVDQGNETFRSVDGVLFSEQGTKLLCYPAGKGDSAYQVPEGVTQIDVEAFRNAAALESVVLPETVLTLWDDCFLGCTSLSSVELTESIGYIGHYAFLDCPNLTEVTLPAHTNHIGAYAFGYLRDNLSMDSDGVVSFQYKPVEGFQIRGYAGTAGEAYANQHGFAFTDLGTPPDAPNVNVLSYTIQDGQVTITGGDKARGDVVIPESIEGYPVTEIAEKAFFDCNSITSIVVPDSVTKIGSYAFLSCRGLTSVTLPGSVETLPYGVFQNCAALTSVTIPEGVTSIGGEAFIGCDNLREIILPSSLKTIEIGAFSGCTALTDILWSEGLTTIGRSAFSGCIGLSSMILPGSLTEIQESAFSDCTSLDYVELPEGLLTLGYSVFWNCTSLKELYVPASVTFFGDTSFGCIPGGVMEDCVLYGYPGSAAAQYAYYNDIAFVYLLDSFLDDDGHRSWSWASDYIYSCVGAGLLSGYPDGTFLPDKDISRIEFVSVLYRTYLAVGGEVIDGDNPFTDATSNWYQEALSWAYTTGLTTGKTDTTFAPNDTLSRAELVTFLFRYLTTFYEGVEPVGDALQGFTDAGQVPAYAWEAMNFCVGNGIVNGSTPTTLAPKATATRGQTAAIFARTFLGLE